jgi:hypothetical protein
LGEGRFPDAIYRADPEGLPMYPTEEALFGEVHAHDMDLVEQIREAFIEADISMAKVYCPLAMGGHVDHRIIRMAAERFMRPLTYYFDFPYAARGGDVPPELGRPSGECVFVPLTEDAIETWSHAVTEYQTQGRMKPSYFPNCVTTTIRKVEFHCSRKRWGPILNQTGCRKAGTRFADSLKQRRIFRQ